MNKGSIFIRRRPGCSGSSRGVRAHRRPSLEGRAAVSRATAWARLRLGRPGSRLCCCQVMGGPFLGSASPALRDDRGHRHGVHDLTGHLCKKMQTDQPLLSSLNAHEGQEDPPAPAPAPTPRCWGRKQVERGPHCPLSSPPPRAPQSADARPVCPGCGHAWAHTRTRTRCAHAWAPCALLCRWIPPCAQAAPPGPR